MELAGELVAGRFFAGIDGLCFAAPEIAAGMAAAGEEQGFYWLNAADPASVAGLGGGSSALPLPARSASARLCFRGAELAAVARRGGRVLEISPSVSPDDDSAARAIAAFASLPRHGAPVIESVNGETAASSAWADCLRAAGFVNDRGRLARY
jgi:ATP-dependent Lhr-like helicase